MSEIPLFTDKPPVNPEDTNSIELQIGIKKMRDLLLGVMALQGVGQRIRGTVKEKAALAEVV